MEPLAIVGAVIVTYCWYIALVDDAHDRRLERRRSLPVFTGRKIMEELRREGASLADKWRRWTSRNIHDSRLHLAINSVTRLSGPYLLIRQPVAVRATCREWQVRR